jgi:hypothetical protein
VAEAFTVLQWSWHCCRVVHCSSMLRRTRKRARLQCGLQ